MAQKYASLSLKGNEVVQYAELTNLCQCGKFIEPGDLTVRSKTYQLHRDCAQKWCDTNSVESDYPIKI